jgi:hypothetical protein
VIVGAVGLWALLRPTTTTPVQEPAALGDPEPARTTPVSPPLQSPPTQSQVPATQTQPPATQTQPPPPRTQAPVGETTPTASATSTPRPTTPPAVPATAEPLGTSRPGTGAGAEERVRANGLVRRANAKYEAGDYDGAIDDLKRALAAVPGHDRAARLLKSVLRARETEAKMPRRRPPPP